MPQLIMLFTSSQGLPDSILAEPNQLQPVIIGKSILGRPAMRLDKNEMYHESDNNRHKVNRKKTSKPYFVVNKSEYANVFLLYEPKIIQCNSVMPVWFPRLSVQQRLKKPVYPIIYP